MQKEECCLSKIAQIPIELYKSLRGEYFIGYADNLTFGNSKNAYAILQNPIDSNVNLHVNVWTVTDISQSAFRVQFWFNSTPPGTPVQIAQVTPSNTAICPLPKPKIILKQASDITGTPTGGIKAFVRRGTPDTTLVETENGKLIFPPGGSFLVFLSSEGSSSQSLSGRVAFGWWEEKICCDCVC